MSTTDSDVEITPGLAFEGGWAYSAEDAGDVVLEGRTVCPGGIGLTSHGIAFGPVELSAYTDTTARIKNLQYGAQQSGGFFDGWGDNSTDFFGSAAVAGAGVATAQQPGEANPEVSRRDMLVSTGLMILGTAGATSAARAATSDGQVSVARFELPANPGGLRVRLRDLAPAYLSTDALYYVLVDGMDYAEFRGGTGQSGDIPPIPDGETHQVEVTTDGEGLLASAKALAGEKALEYSFTMDPTPSESSVGTQLTITDHPMIREATLRAGEGAVTLEIGGESVPHQSEDRGDEVGWYGVVDGDVVYQVGTQPPSGSQAEFSVYAGILDETLDDASRVIS